MGTTMNFRRLLLLSISGLVSVSLAAAQTPAPAAKLTGQTPAPAPAPAGQRLFVCAHSFMIYTARLLPEITKAAGIQHVNAGQQMLGGSRTIQHWNLPDEKNMAKAALLSGKVDVLTLSPHMQLPDEGIDNYTRLGLEKNPELRVLVQASWPPRDGEMSRGFSNARRNDVSLEKLYEMRAQHNSGWLKNMEAQAAALNASAGRQTVCIIPVCTAVYALREKIIRGEAPGLRGQADLFSDDLGHPQPALAMLVTYCHYATIYQRSPVGLPVPSILKAVPKAEELNRLLQQIAWETVSGYPMSGVPAQAAAAAP